MMDQMDPPGHQVYLGEWDGDSGSLGESHITNDSPVIYDMFESMNHYINQVFTIECAWYMSIMNH